MSYTIKITDVDTDSTTTITTDEISTACRILINEVEFTWSYVLGRSKIDLRENDPVSAETLDCATKFVPGEKLGFPLSDSSWFFELAYDPADPFTDLGVTIAPFQGGSIYLQGYACCQCGHAFWIERRGTKPPLIEPAPCPGCSTVGLPPTVQTPGV